jgi:autotransporter-associated beta strand protein
MRIKWVMSDSPATIKSSRPSRWGLSSSVAAALVSAGLLLLLPPLSAQTTYTYGDGTTASQLTGNWHTAGAWYDGAGWGDWVDGGVARFFSPTNGISATNTLGAPVQLGGLIKDAAGTNLTLISQAGHTLGFSDGATITVNHDMLATQGGAITGSNVFVTGMTNGTLRLGPTHGGPFTNRLSGLTMESVTLKLSQAHGVAAVGGNVVVNSGVLEHGAAFNNRRDNQYAEGSTLTINGGTVLKWSTTQTLDSFTWNGGTLTIWAGANLNLVGDEALTLRNVTLTRTGGAAGQTYNINLTKHGAQTVRFDAARNGMAVMTEGTALVLGGGVKTFHVENGTATTDMQVLIHAISETAPSSIRKTGAGVVAWNVSGATNSYSEGMTVEEGALFFVSTNALPASGVTVSDGAVLGLRMYNDQFTEQQFLDLHAGTWAGVAMGAAAYAGFENTGTLRLGAALGGTRGLAKLGGGNLILTGENTYTGGTLINQGNLQIGDGGTAGSISGDVVMASAGDSFRQLIFNRSDNLTFSGKISGSGSLLKQGAGTLVLSGLISYSGSTTVSGGALVLSNSPDFVATVTATSLAVDFAPTLTNGSYQIFPASLQTGALRDVSLTVAGAEVPGLALATGGAVIAMVNVQPPANLSYTPANVTGFVGSPLPNLSPHVSGAVTLHAVTPPLPAGLSLDPATGVISGTPTAESPPTAYTITASNPGGSTATVVTLQVTATDPVIAYSPGPVTAYLGVPLGPLVPSVSGAITRFEVAPPLPDGVFLDPATGAIGGTPAAVTPGALYTITAANDAGQSGTAGLELSVILPPPPVNLAYSPSIFTLTLGVPMPVLTPAVNGPVTEYSVEPSLPTGISLDPATGVIGGTPLAVEPPTVHTVTARNAGGSATATVTSSVRASGQLGQMLVVSQDAHINGRNTTNNYGGRNTLVLKPSESSVAGSFGQKAFLHFDASGRSDLVGRVESLRLAYAAGVEGSIAAYVITGPRAAAWEESGINWLNAPGNNVRGRDRDFVAYPGEQVTELGRTTGRTNGEVLTIPVAAGSAGETALLDALNAGDRRVTIGLRHDGAGEDELTVYAREFGGGAAAATLAIQPMSGYRAWHRQWFGQAGAEAPVRERDSFAGDGTANVLKFAFALDPTRVARPADLPRGLLNGDHLSLRFRRARDAGDVVMRVLASTNLSNWSEVLWDSRLDPYGGGAGEFEVLEVVDPVPIRGHAFGKRFLRLDAGREASPLGEFAVPVGPPVSGDAGAALAAAFERIRQESLTRNFSNAVIALSPGTYPLTDTLVIGPGQLGNFTGRLEITGAGTNTVLTGSAEVEGWQPADHPLLPAAAQGKVWVADLPPGQVPKVVYDNIGPLPRSRGAGFAPASAGATRTNFTGPAGLLPAGAAPDGVELSVRPYHLWVHNILPLATYDPVTGAGTTALPATYPIFPVADWAGGFVPASAWLENHPALISQPGHWAVDPVAGKLYLWPRSGTNAPSGVRAARLIELLRLEGDEAGGKPLSGVTLRGLTFTEADRESIRADDAGLQHDWDFYDKANAMLRLRWVEDVTVENCLFINSGAAGLRADLHAQRVRVVGNTFRGLGGGGILFSGYGPGTKDLNKNNEIHGNLVEDCGRLVWHSPGIHVWQSGGNRVTRNLVRNLPYTGIIVSGVGAQFFRNAEAPARELERTIRWGEVPLGPNYTTSTIQPYLHTRNNLVAGNEITDVMRTMGDGNGIYIRFAAQTGNVIRGNYVHQITGPRSAGGIRCDGEQSGITVEGNYLHRVNFTGISINGRNILRNNFLVDILNRDNATAQQSPFVRGSIQAMNQPSSSGSVIQRNVFLQTAPGTPEFYSLGFSQFLNPPPPPPVLEDFLMGQNLYWVEGNPDHAAAFVADLQARQIDPGSLAVAPADGTGPDGLPVFRPEVLQQLQIQPFDWENVGLP